MRVDGQVCFRLPTGESAPSFGPGLLLRLRDVHQEALADLLQVFACGEESASLAFARLGGAPLEEAARCGLARIAEEELVHEPSGRAAGHYPPPNCKSMSCKRKRAV